MSNEPVKGAAGIYEFWQGGSMLDVLAAYMKVNAGFFGAAEKSHLLPFSAEKTHKKPQLLQRWELICLLLLFLLYGAVAPPISPMILHMPYVASESQISSFENGNQASRFI